jgi:hypothetical protein
MWKDYQIDLITWHSHFGSPTQENIDKIDERSEEWGNHTDLDRTFFDHRELERYRGFMLQELQMVQDDVEKWMTRLEFGCDEPLKVILLALSEGVRDLIYFDHDKTQESEEETSPLNMFPTSLRSILRSPPESRQWPVGFKALRSITIAERTTDRDGSFIAGPATVAPLFMLPSIAKLTLHGLEFGNETAYNWEWDEHVSTVVDLELSFNPRHEITTSSFIRACKALRSFRYDGLLADSRSKPVICPSLLEHAKDSIEEIRTDPFSSYVTLKDLDGLLTRFSILRHVWIKDTCLFSWDAIEKCPPSLKRRPESYDQIRAQWLDLREHMPRTLETLHIQFGQDYWPHEECSNSRAIAFCERMEEFVRSKNIHTGQWGKFRVLCIGHAFLCHKAKTYDMKTQASAYVVHDLLALLRNACADNNVELCDADDVRHSCGQYLDRTVMLEPV